MKGYIEIIRLAIRHRMGIKDTFRVLVAIHELNQALKKITEEE